MQWICDGMHLEILFINSILDLRVFLHSIIKIIESFQSTDTTVKHNVNIKNPDELDWIFYV